MLPLEERVNQRKRKEQLMILSETEAEYDLIKRERELAEQDYTLEGMFYTHGKAAMMSAKFYHECILLDIPCVLDVYTKYGEVDAIIDLKGKFIVIEFKSHKRLVKTKETKEQLARYAQHLYPVILSYESDQFHSLLLKLRRKKLLNIVYLFEGFKFKRYDLPTKTVDN